MSPDDDRSRERPEDGPDAERQAAAWEDIVRRLREDEPPHGAVAAPTDAPQDHRPGGEGPSGGGSGERSPSYDVPSERSASEHTPPEHTAAGGPGHARAHDWRSWGPADGGDGSDAEDPEEDWQPADPGDVTAGMRPGTLIAWILLLGVGAILVVLGLVLRGLPFWLWAPGLAIVLGCLISLFQSLPEQRSDDDDGARV